ncbi:glycoside hydrolase family 6 protein [Catellatospora bangladeshensis]|uniref:glycoside hydrolase family 6 protein n=1 Tax=Catellatospora bangladeshensis TaxID=310355 RepID=UPI0036240B74
MHTRRRRLLASLAAVALTAAAAAPAAAAGHVAPADRTLPADTRFYVDPDAGAARQALADLRVGNVADAVRMGRLATWPQAIWIDNGTPAQIGAQVRKIMAAARLTRTVPVLVSYFIPGRDCSLYSAGGAQSSAEYRAWISAFAAAIGDGRAVVVVEPDGLSLLPKDCAGNIDPTGELTAQRLADLKAAVGLFGAQPNTSVYLDAGNSGWQPVGVIAERLVQAGVGQARGFALNVSNYWRTDQNTRYATWVAKCIWWSTRGPDWARGHADWCASQYYSAAAPNDGQPGNAVVYEDPATWHWTDAWFDQNVGDPPVDQLAHNVIDTSRNGLGPGPRPPASTPTPRPGATRRSAASAPGRPPPPGCR